MEGRRTLLSAAAVLLALVAVVPAASALRCYQCGLYTDGVGSITPCINHTAELHLKDCPKEKNKFCLKFVSEGISVRSCADKCDESQSGWGGYFYCCNMDGCNNAPGREAFPLLVGGLGAIWLLLSGRLF